jgi:beta-glucanase (GH16 family)
MNKPRIFMCILQLLVVILLSSCDEEKISNTNDPTNLVVEVIISNNGSGVVSIQASANNTVEYQLLIGSNTSPVATNTTGIFEHTFVVSGTYAFEVRAYGSSGRYIKESRQITITVGSGPTIDDGYTTPMSYDNYQLMWNDEFDGNSVNTSNWVFEIGTGSSGWGNNELQYYRQENAKVEGGLLTIEARKETYQGSNYTSTRMITRNKKSFQYGRVDIRALLPKGQGLWPALWMLGNNIQTVGWPSCGEIDIMEMVGGSGRENQTHGTVHWDNGGHQYVGGSYTLPSGTFADEYHVFTIIWNETSIKWYVNDTKFYEINITPTHMTEFHQKFFFIFNVAVGGNWPGSPNESTVFPQRMKVDYIRVFQQN